MWEKRYEETPATITDLTFTYLASMFKLDNGMSQDNPDTLVTLGLKPLDDNYILAAEWFADHNDTPGIDAIWFDGSLNTIRDREHVHGVSLPEQYHVIDRFYERYYVQELIAGGRRERIELVPQSAFREALINAIIHRSYAVSAAVTVAMFADRIEIDSPGGLPPGLTKDMFLYHNISVPRNPTVTNVFQRLKLIEHFGSGIGRIKSVYENSAVQPIFLITDGAIKVTLPAIIPIDEQTFNKVERQLLAVFKNGSSLSRVELEKLTELPRMQVLRGLSALLDYGVIVKVGAGRGTRYRRA